MKRITRMMIAMAVLLVGSTAAWAGDTQTVRLVTTGTGVVTVKVEDATLAFDGDGKSTTTVAAGAKVTLTVAPDADQYADVLSVNKTIDIPSPSPAPRRSGGISTGDVTLTLDPGSTGNLHETNTYTFTMPSSDYSGVNIVVTFAARTSVSTTGEGSVTIADIAPQTYTGAAIAPELTVKHGETVLTAGKDYTVAYTANTNAGNATATVSFIGKYKADNSANKAFTISKAPLTITAKPKTITYGDAPANDGVEYDGFVGGEDESKLTGTLGYAYSYAQYGNVGSYTITPSGLASDNYDITFTPGTLTVNKAPLTITALDKSVTYGEAAPEYTVNYSGFVHTDTKDVLGGILTIACTYAQNAAVGTYDITPSGLSAQNYAITYQKGTLTVSLASLTLYDNADNSDAISEVVTNYGSKADVTLSGRTLTAGQWNTLCLPFSLNSSQIAACFGAGTEVKTLSSYANDGTTVTVTFADVTTIEAGKPYIVKPTTSVVDPAFTDVTISNTMTDVTVGGATFKGTDKPVALPANDKKKLYLANDKLWYPTANLNVRTCRAYFELTADVPETAGAPSIVIDYGETTGVHTMAEGRSVMEDVWYTLDGRKVHGQRLKEGVYIHNGRKEVIK